MYDTYDEYLYSLEQEKEKESKQAMYDCYFEDNDYEKEKEKEL